MSLMCDCHVFINNRILALGKVLFLANSVPSLAAWNHKNLVENISFDVIESSLLVGCCY